MQADGGAKGAVRAVVQLIYPPRCISCAAPVGSDFGLCPTCWRETPFTAGLVCDLCGVTLPGDDPGHAVACDDCIAIARPWERGRAALIYRDGARALVLKLKHADRTDLARPMAEWLHRAAKPILTPGMLVAPVPLHWWRLFRRRYNQAALLAGGMAALAGLDHCPDLLQRRRATGTQDGRSRDGRFANMQGALRVHPGRKARVMGRDILLVDDVMTSGATLSAAAEAVLAAGARRVCVAVLARVAKDA